MVLSFVAPRPGHARHSSGPDSYQQVPEDSTREPRAVALGHHGAEAEEPNDRLPDLMPDHRHVPTTRRTSGGHDDVGSLTNMTDNTPTVTDVYTGEVSLGTGSQRRTLSNASIVKTSVGPMDNNAYLIVCSDTGKSLLVDAANDAATLRALIDHVAPDLTTIVTTHQHFDHWQALEEVAAHADTPTLAHPLDAEPLPVVPSGSVVDGDTVTVGRLELEVIHLRGHTPGSIALALTDPADGTVHLFTGDSLFPGGVGKTDGEANFRSLVDDVETKLFDRFDDSTVVYPGHGKDTTLGTERPHLHEWRARGW